MTYTPLHIASSCAFLSPDSFRDYFFPWPPAAIFPSSLPPYISPGPLANFSLSSPLFLSPVPTYAHCPLLLMRSHCSCLDMWNLILILSISISRRTWRNILLQDMAERRAWSVFEAMWPPEVQVVGKDILRFHAVLWPSILLALGLSPPRRILCHPHWLVGRRLMLLDVALFPHIHTSPLCQILIISNDIRISLFSTNISNAIDLPQYLTHFRYLTKYI